MKINLAIDGYDIHSLSEIFDTAQDFSRRCDFLEAKGVEIMQKIEACSGEFTSINYLRARAAIEDYAQKLAVSRVELAELVKSCNDFAEKIEAIWR